MIDFSKLSDLNTPGAWDNSKWGFEKLLKQEHFSWQNKIQKSHENAQS